MNRLFRVANHVDLSRSATRGLSPVRAMSTASSSSAAPVRVQVHANGCGQITLTRTNALNALNLEMIKIMLHTLRQWRCDPDVTCVLIDAQMDAKRRTKVFCAGGDVKFLHSPPYAAGPADFLRYEYTLDYCVHSFPKPVVSLLDGVVLGGGVGLTAGSTFKIVTDKTSWAMPETTIGLFPDVGTTHTLSRMDNHFGYFLGLTGLRIGAKALLECGFADYYLPQTATGVFRENMVTASTVKNVTDAASLGRVLAGLGCSTSAPDSLPGSLVGVQGVSEACFSQDSVSGIMAALQRATQDMNIPEAAQQWAGKALKKLREVSPTSLRVTLQQLDLNKTCSVEDAFRNDFRLCVRLIEEQEGDFKEGVRALLIDKDKNPRWQNADMTEEELAVYVQRFTYTTESAFYVKDLEVQSKQDTPCE